MGKKTEDSDNESSLPLSEDKKRRREWSYVLGLGLIFLSLSWTASKLFGMSRSLPMVHSIFFLGLVNFNIIIFLVLAFLIFRNVAKVFAERQSGPIGGSLKSKLIAAFVSFSFVPTALMFLVSVFYINNSFDKWFSEKMSGVLVSSLEVTNAYYKTTTKKNYHFAEEIVRELNGVSGAETINKKLNDLRKRYRLDAVEYYSSLLNRSVSVSTEEGIPEIPRATAEFLQKGLIQKDEASTMHYFGDGNLVRVIVPMKGGHRGAVVVSSFVPLSLIAKINNIASAYEEIRDANPLEYPLKTIYLIILILMTLVILLGATWFGFYLAKQLSIPLEKLGSATEAVARGEFKPVDLTSGSREVNQLISSFNTMTGNLQATLARLNEHSKYIEIVLANVTTGVISIDNEGVITMVNQHAEGLLEIDAKEYVGKLARETLPREFYTIVEDLISALRKHKAQSLRKEGRIEINGRSVPVQMTLTLLFGDEGQEIGKIVVVDDLTVVLNAQRAVAWKEVARRIAHEIKNPLTPIKLSAERLQKKFGEGVHDPAFNECIQMIIQQVDGLKFLVNEFSQFARMPQLKPTLNDLNQVIADGISLFVQAHKNVNIEFQPDKRLPLFLFDSEQLQRAVQNLVDNAIAAVQRDPSPHVVIQTEFENALKIARIFVVDNGPGIMPQLKDRIFEPYVTSKKEGTGLGLAIVKRTVEDHNGFVRALSVLPHGTKVVVELPVVEVQTIQGSAIRTATTNEG